MPKRSAGIIAYRYNPSGDLEVLLVHPGGPFWKNKDERAWSIPKGEYDEGDDPLTAARREFTEETGNIIEAQSFIELAPVKISSGKVITAWVAEANFEKPFITSNFFEMEWPPRSGKKQTFPETDKAEWFTIPAACTKINAGQLPLLDQLVLAIKK